MHKEGLEPGGAFYTTGISDPDTGRACSRI